MDLGDLRFAGGGSMDDAPFILHDPGASGAAGSPQAAQAGPSVIIVSDVLLYRDGLATSLRRDGRLNVDDLVDSANALPAISRARPAAALLDCGMVGCLGLARNIRANVGGVCLVGFGISGGPDRFVDCAESGLAAFVGSNSSVSELVNAVLGALKGELECSPEVSALMCERLACLSAAHGQRPSALTLREKQIAALIGQGLSNKEIAIDLNIGPSTVKNHVHSILEKLHVRRRSAIVHQLSEFTWMKESQAAEH